MKKHTISYVTGLLLFGLNGIVASRIAINSLSIVFFRTLIGSALLASILLAGREKPGFSAASRVHLLYVLCSGAAMGTSWMFLYEAYRRIGVGLASLLYYTGPVLVMMLSPVLFREKLTFRKVMCFAVVLAGMVLTNLRQLHAGEDRTGLACGLGSAVMYAVMVVLNKKASSVTGLKNSAIQLTASFLTVAAFAAVRGGPELPDGAAEWLWMLVLGAVNTGAGCYLYFSSIGRLPVQTVSVLGYIEPLSALVFSFVFLRESFGAVQLLGAALILGGALAMELPAKERAPQKDSVTEKGI